MTTIIGIDPGKSGGIAWISPEMVVQACKMPATMPDLVEFFRNLAGQWGTVDGAPRAALEKLGQMPRDKKTGKSLQSPTSMFKMGRSYGDLETAIYAAGIPFEEVLPTTWQIVMGLTGKWASSTVKKNAHKAVAQGLFPQLKITHATADALLIAEWLRRRELTVREEAKELEG